MKRLIFVILFSIVCLLSMPAQEWAHGKFTVDWSPLAGSNTVHLVGDFGFLEYYAWTATSSLAFLDTPGDMNILLSIGGRVSSEPYGRGFFFAANLVDGWLLFSSVGEAALPFSMSASVGYDQGFGLMGLSVRLSMIWLGAFSSKGAVLPNVYLGVSFALSEETCPL